jgi:hypothetical protein
MQVVDAIEDWNLQPSSALILCFLAIYTSSSRTHWEKAQQ